MANTKNLKPLNKRTKDEQRKICSAGGRRSGQVRRHHKTMRECLEYLLDCENPADEHKLTFLECICAKIMRQALAGNVKAFEVIRDTIGQNPKMQDEQNAPVDNGILPDLIKAHLAMCKKMEKERKAREKQDAAGASVAAANDISE